jgi:hypothetical protein
VPPPGTYNPDPIKPKLIGPIKSTVGKGQFIQESEYRGFETSAPGQYKVSYN